MILASCNRNHVETAMRGAMDEVTPQTTLARLQRFFEVASERGMALDARAIELAELLGIARETVYAWRRGSSPIDPLKAHAITAAISKLEEKYDIS